MKPKFDSVDDELRNGLWNAIYLNFLEKIQKDSFQGSIPDEYDKCITEIWCFFLKHPADSKPRFCWVLNTVLKKWFFSCPWYNVYDFLEVLIRTAPLNMNLSRMYDAPSVMDEFVATCNRVLESENSGYRFVGHQIAPIVDQYERKEIESAIITASKLEQQGVQVHLKKALERISDRKNPDYEGSIKESVSAVESLASMMAGKKQTLTKALTELEKTVKIHPALKIALEKIYGYTSDEEGIRHAMLEGPKCDIEDASFMLSACAAFINYLMAKAQKAKIKL